MSSRSNVCGDATEGLGIQAAPLRGRTALVTGASRGLGEEVARQLAALGCRVIVAARDVAAGQRVAADLDPNGGGESFIELDVRDDAHTRRAGDWVARKFGALDILINNAGVYVDDPRAREIPWSEDLTPDEFADTLNVNVVGAFRLIRQFLPGMKARNYGRIVNVSSGMGRSVEISADSPFYRASKAALNLLTGVIAAELRGFDIIVNAVCPGWVRTRMGGPDAVRSVEQGARGIVLAARLPRGGISGQLLRDGERFGW